MCGIMVPMKELSNDLKLRIIKCLKDGMSQRKVSLPLQCGQSTVYTSGKILWNQQCR